MSQEHIKVVGELIDAVNRRDPDAFVACLTPDVEWDDTEGWPGIRKVYHGRAGVRKWWDAFMSVGDIVSAEVEEIAEGRGGRVLVGVFGTFRGGSSGTEFEARAWYVFWLVDGKAGRVKLFWARDQALKAAGLLE
jgi:ketosteroid isomerase-like protein